MSSIRVRAQNKVMEKLGAAKKSSNIQFDNAFAGFESMQSDVVQLDQALGGFISALKGFHSASSVLSRAIHQVSNVESDQCPPQVKQFISVYTDLAEQIDMTTFSAQLDCYQKTVLKASEGWVAQCDDLKTHIGHYNESHQNYDHYTRKVVSLREQRDKRAAQGKSEKAKEVDKLIRNEQKLVAATKGYREISDATIANLNQFTQSRYTTLNPLVQRLIQYRISYSKQMAESCEKFKILLQAGAGAADDAYLDRLTQLVDDKKKAEATENGLSQIDLSEKIVSKTFDDFVGDQSRISQHSYHTTTNQVVFNPFEPTGNDKQQSVLDDLFSSPTARKVEFS